MNGYSVGVDLFFADFPEWYYGYNIKNRFHRGIFPQNYVHEKKAVVQRTGWESKYILSRRLYIMYQYMHISYNIKYAYMILYDICITDMIYVMQSYIVWFVFCHF